MWTYMYVHTSYLWSNSCFCGIMSMCIHACLATVSVCIIILCMHIVSIGNILLSYIRYRWHKWWYRLLGVNCLFHCRCVELSCHHWRETSSMFWLHLHCNRWQESSDVWRVQWRAELHEWCLHHWPTHYGNDSLAMVMTVCSTHRTPHFESGVKPSVTVVNTCTTQSPSHIRYCPSSFF